MNTTHITYTLEGKSHAKTFAPGTNEDEVFTEAARMICFSDCSDIQVDDVVVDGKRYTYGGWLPGMRFAFYDERGARVWMDCFPDWNH